MRARAGWLGRLAAMSSAALVVAGCSDGPSGPGTHEVTVQGPTPLGAVVIEVTGSGVGGFVGRGDTRAYGTVLSATEGRHRVVLVDEAGGTIEFAIEVDDLGADKPSLSLLYAAGSDNQTLGTTGIEARIGR